MAITDDRRLTLDDALALLLDARCTPARLAQVIDIVAPLQPDEVNYMTRALARQDRDTLANLGDRLEQLLTRTTAVTDPLPDTDGITSD